MSPKGTEARRVRDDVPHAPAPPVGRAAALAAGLLALLVLADLPGLLTRGDLVRGALLPLVAAGVLLLGAARAGRFARGDRAALLLLALPWLLLVPSVLSISRPALLAPAALARHASAWLALPALTLGLWRLCAGPRDLLRWWRATLLAGAVAAAWVYVEALVTAQAGAGPFGRPGVAGPFLGALLGPALLAPWTRRRALRALVGALLLAGAAFTHSRTGLAAGALSLLLAAGLAPPPRLSASLRRAALALAGVGTVVAGLLLVGLCAPPGDGVTLEVRRGVWRGAAALIVERPALGHGLGSFRSEILRRRDLDEARLSRGREPFMAHQDVLHASVEGGLGAGLLVAALYLGALALAWRAWRRGRDPWAAAAFAALAALAAASLAEQVLPDPAPATLLALALATALSRARPAPLARGAPAVRGAALAAALLLLGTGALRARDVVADRHLVLYREVVASGPTVAVAEAAAREHLLEGVLRWSPDSTEGLYRLGVSEAKLGRLASARDAWHRALEVEPGLSEARLDLAESYALEGRRGDARAVIVEARAFDPTRYDLALRQGHLAMGPEPVPGGPSDGAFEPIEPLRSYNEAERLAPGRFETDVAFARAWRRTGDLEGAGRYLRLAAARAFDEGEVLLESFHLAEAEGRADVPTLASILTLALARDPQLDAVVTREARACEEAGGRRETAAKAAAPALTAPDFTAADRAYACLTVRLLARLEAGLLDANTLVEEAQRLGGEGGQRAALARYRALVAYVGDAAPEGRAERITFYERRGNLLIETAQAAARVDGALARTFYAEGHLLKGLEFLERGDLPAAHRLLAEAVAENPTDARASVLLARVAARAGHPDEAEASLLEALRRDPGAAAALGAEPDLVEVLRRPALRAALAPR